MDTLRARRKPRDVPTLHLCALVDLLALCTIFLLLQFDGGPQVGRLSLVAPREVDEQTLHLVVRAGEIVLAIGSDPELARSSRADAEWLTDQLRLLHHFREGVTHVAMTVDDDVRLDDVIGVLDACAGAGLSVAIDPTVKVAHLPSQPNPVVAGAYGAARRLY